MLLARSPAEDGVQAGQRSAFSRRDVFVDGRPRLLYPLDQGRPHESGCEYFRRCTALPAGVSRLDMGPMVETRLPLERSSPVWWWNGVKRLPAMPGPAPA